MLCLKALVGRDGAMRAEEEEEGKIGKDEKREKQKNRKPKESKAGERAMNKKARGTKVHRIVFLIFRLGQS
jgi:hypothetical protein